MVALQPLGPAPSDQKPLFQGSKANMSKYHPLLSVVGQNHLRAHLSISDWLVLGGFVQAAVALFSPLPVIYSLAPTFALLGFKILRTVAIILGLVKSTHMKNVRLGRTSGVFPGADGTWNREPGETVNGGGMCIILLSSRCNHPLGNFYPPYAKLSKYAEGMFRELEMKAEEYGLLGYSQYIAATERLTKPTGLNIMYFRSVEHLHKFAHGKTHRECWDWWDSMVGKVDHVTISHEVYTVPDGGWETIYHNSEPYDSAATSHAIQAAGGVKETKWACPIVNAEKGFKEFKGASARMGVVKDAGSSSEKR